MRRRPKLRITDTPYADAFQMLHAARAFGAAAPNPIAIAEIHALCSLLGIVRRSERSKYLRLIQLLDGLFLTHWAEKNPPQGSKPARGHKN